MSPEEFDSREWRRGVSVIYKVRNVEAVGGWSVHETKVTGVEFNSDKIAAGGVYAKGRNGSKIFVHHNNIIKIL